MWTNYILSGLQQDKMPQTPPFPAMFGSNGYNNNLYQTKEEDYSGLYYHDNNLVSGSLEALIQHLVPTVAYYPDVRTGLSLLQTQHSIHYTVNSHV